MKSQKGITLIMLVAIIIILIILAGISINTLVGENGIITKAKEAKQNIILAGEAEGLQLNQLYYELETGGELTEDEESAKKDEIIALLQKQVEELQNQVSSLQTENEDLKQQITDLNTQIEELQTELESLRDQISQKDIEIADLRAQVSEKQGQIDNLQSQLDTLNSLLSQTNATADKILVGYTAYSGGELLTGTMVNRGAVSNSLNCGQSYTIPAGYHNGSGKVTANSLASQTSATATAADILSGKTAWVNGKLIKGTKTNSGEKLYLYQGGDECTNITGGWSSALTKNANNMTLTSSYSWVYASTNNQIDVSDYKYLCADLATTMNNHGIAGLTTTQATVSSQNYLISLYGTSRNIVKVDITNVSESLYGLVGASACTATFYNIWLEK